MIDNYKLYCLTNKINGKQYIGITKQNVKTRWRKGTGYKPNTRINKAILKYGWDNFMKEILFDNLSQEEAIRLEKEYISLLDTINNGYNVQEGGLGGANGEITDELRKKLSNSHKGLHCSPKTEFKKGDRSKAHFQIMKPVYCVELDRIFDCIADAEKELNLSHHIHDCLKGKRNKCGGYHWKYVKEMI